MWGRYDPADAWLTPRLVRWGKTTRSCARKCRYGGLGLRQDVGERGGVV